MRIATYAFKKDNQPKSQEISWADLVAVLSEHELTPCGPTAPKPCKGATCEFKSKDSWSPVDIPDGLTRADANVRAVTAAVFDLDHLAHEQLGAALKQVAGYAFVVHSTHNHLREGSDDCCMRLVMPLSSPVPAAQWREFLAKAIAKLELPADPSCKDLARLYYLPSAPEGGPKPEAAHRDGRVLDVEAILGTALQAAVNPAPRPARIVVPEVPTLTDAERTIATKALGDRLYRLETENKDLARRIIDGADVLGPRGADARTGHPGQDAMLQKVARMLAGVAVNVDPRLTASDLLAVLRSSLEKADWGDGYPHLLGEAHAKLQRAVEHWREKRATEIAEREHKNARDLGSLRRALHLDPVPPSQPPAPPQPADQQLIAESSVASAEYDPLADAPAGVPVPEQDHVANDLDEAGGTRKCTDLGNAERIKDRYRDRLRYVPAWAVWLGWDHCRWVRDGRAQAANAAAESARAIWGEIDAAARVGDMRKAELLSKHAVLSEGASRIRASLELAQGMFIVSHEDLDANRFLLNVRNGTLDLRTGTLRTHRREDLITKLAPVDYDQNARAPLWEAFLSKVVPSPAVRTFLARAVGHALTGDVSEQSLLFLFGGGANGKSVFLGTVQAMLGEYAKSGAPDLLLSKQNESHPTEKAHLQGARLVVCQEVEQGRSFAEKTIKELTGGDLITARFMGQNFFSFEPTFKLWLAGNHRPRVRGTDHAIWRRIHLVPFNVTIPNEERDPNLAEKLRGELPGILTWAVRGCLEWQRERLNPPPEVTGATKEYRGEQDHIGEFLAERCEVALSEWTSSTDLYQAYKAWCLVNGENPWAKRAVGEHLPAHGLRQERRNGGKRGWGGVRLRNSLSLTGTTAVEAVTQ